VNEHDRLVDRAAREARTVLFVGGLDAGKSTLARATAAFALRLGRTVAGGPTVFCATSASR